jgi:hypothetical protein
MTFHLRGTALDRYSSKGTWSQSDDSRIPLAPSGANPVSVEPGRVVQTKAPTMEVTLDPIEPPVLFVPAGATGVMLKSPSVALPNQHPYLIRGPGGELRYHTEERGVSYTVFLGGRSGPPRGSLSPSERRKYLQVPEDLSEELRALAAEWVDGAATDREKASAVLQRLRTDFAYDLDSPSTRADVPLDDFLFESKRGHCSFFSSAMAIMLRTQGIPTRNVTGFAGGTYNKYSESYVVRQGDAHSWVEVWLDDAGWVTFDPTPAAGEGSRTVLSEPWSTLTDFIEATSQRWNHHVVQYDLDRQYALLSGLGDGEDDESTSGGIPWRLLVLLALAGAAVGLGVTLWRRRRKKTAAVRVGDGPRSKELARATALYESLEQALAVHGITRPPGTPPLKHAEALVATEHPVGEETLEVTKVYLAVRFGKMTLSTEADADLSRRIRSIREQPRTGGPS